MLFDGLAPRAREPLGQFVGRNGAVALAQSSQDRQENLEIFDFKLDDTDMNALSSLDKGEAGRTGPNPDVFDYIPD